MIMKLSIVVVASLAIACCAAENRKIDEVQYKNHRLSTDDTKAPSSGLHNKYSVYPAQVYANLTNVKDFTTVKSAPEKSANQATTMETSGLQDVVRVFVSPATEKKRKPDYQPVAAMTTQASSFSKTSSSSPPSVHLVPAKSATAPAVTTAVVKEKQSPAYSRPSPPGNFKETADYPTRTTTTAVAEDEAARGNKPRNNDGTQTRRVLKTQIPVSQQQSHLLYAETTPPPSWPSMVAAGARDTTAFAVTAKVNSSNASKPFTTVLVPKQMLDGDLQLQHDYMHGSDSSFQPIAPPTFSYKPQNVDANSIENRRASNVVKTQTSASVTKSVGYEFAAKQPVTYKVEEFSRGNDQSLFVPDGSYVSNNKQDRFDQTYVPAEKFKQEQVRFNPSTQEVLVKQYDHQRYEVPKHDTPKYDVPKQGIKYGFVVPETVKFEQQPHKNVHSATQFREFYPATEIPPKEVMSSPSYNSEGKFNVRSSPIEMAGQSFESEKLQGTHKELTSPPNRFAPVNSETDSHGPEFVVGDMNPKYVLKSILRDMIKSKQQSEVKPNPSTTVDEIVDSYFKTIRPNVDFSLDNNYDIETGESVIYKYIP